MLTVSGGVIAGTTKAPIPQQTESACAGALGLRLAGDAWYFGKLVPKPYIGDEIHPIEPQDTAGSTA